MFLLDTNVISELLGPQPAPAVAKWAIDCEARGDALYVSAIAKAEMEYGVHIMNDGTKKRVLQQNIQAFFVAHKKSCHAFNARSAAYYAVMRAEQHKSGIDTTRGSDHRDVMMAAIAIQHRLVLVTGDKDFARIKGLVTFNPWHYKRKRVAG